MTLELHPKDRRGATSRFRVVKVRSYTEDVPGIGIWIQDQGMAFGFTLDEEETGMLIKGLRDALEASQRSPRAGADDIRKPSAGCTTYRIT